LNGPPSSKIGNKIRSDAGTKDAWLGKNGPGRNAGEEHAGTQGWRRPRQVAMLPSAGGGFEASHLR